MCIYKHVLLHTTIFLYGSLIMTFKLIKKFKRHSCFNETVFCNQTWLYKVFWSRDMRTVTIGSLHSVVASFTAISRIYVSKNFRSCYISSDTSYATLTNIISFGYIIYIYTFIYTIKRLLIYLSVHSKYIKKTLS